MYMYVLCMYYAQCTFPVYTSYDAEHFTLGQTSGTLEMGIKEKSPPPLLFPPPVGGWFVQTRPARAAFKFTLGGQGRLVATGTGKNAGGFFMQQGAGARPLSAVIAHDMILLGRQALAPLRIGEREGKRLVGHGMTLE